MLEAIETSHWQFIELAVWFASLILDKFESLLDKNKTNKYGKI